MREVFAYVVEEAEAERSLGRRHQAWHFSAEHQEQLLAADETGELGQRCALEVVRLCRLAEMSETAERGGVGRLVSAPFRVGASLP